MTAVDSDNKDVPFYYSDSSFSFAVFPFLVKAADSDTNRAIEPEPTEANSTTSTSHAFFLFKSMRVAHKERSMTAQ